MAAAQVPTGFMALHKMKHPKRYVTAPRWGRGHFACICMPFPSLLFLSVSSLLNMQTLCISSLNVVFPQVWIMGTLSYLAQTGHHVGPVAMWLQSGSPLYDCPAPLSLSPSQTHSYYFTIPFFDLVKVNLMCPSILDTFRPKCSIMFKSTIHSSLLLLYVWSLRSRQPGVGAHVNVCVCVISVRERGVAVSGTWIVHGLNNWQP